MNGTALYARDDFSGLKELLAEENEIFLVYDRNVEWAAEDILMRLGPEDSQTGSIRAAMAIDASEAVKTMDTVLAICRFLLENNADRKALVLALGGGITTDMTGFAALIYKRGVRYANLPTTLLSQVDAGIGGKTGVNFDGYKNILGRIQQPEFVYSALNTLDTLPDADYRSGLAEMLKTFIIADAPHYRRAMSFISKSAPGQRVDRELIQAAAQVKCGVVERDEFETGERRVLNLGHTIGHAVEWWQAEVAAQRQYSHGEAVAIGIIAAAKVSEALGVCKKGLAAQLKADFEAAGLPTECPAPASAIESAIRRDKKAEGASVHFVLIKEIGKVEVRLMPVDDIIHLVEH